MQINSDSYCAFFQELQLSVEIQKETETDRREKMRGEKKGIFFFVYILFSY